jgi:hypothetical protein
MVMTFEEWLEYGMAHGFCTAASCYTHDGFEFTTEEDNEFDQGFDPCVAVVRLWADAEHASNTPDAKNQGQNPDALRLCALLNFLLQGNGYSPFKVTKDAVGAIERLNRIDKRPFDEIETMIRWSQSDEFWLHNIRSPQKLRKHYETMVGQLRSKNKVIQEQRKVVEDQERRVVESMASVRARAEKDRAEAAPMPADIRKALQRGKRQ